MPNLTPQQIEDAARAMPDHVLATSFLEGPARARVIALLLFFHEIARARSVVSEAGLAAIRLQWWRDTLDQIYTGKVVRAQPTAVALASTVQEAKLPRDLLDGMIDGFEAELEAQPFATWANLETYLDATFGNLNRLSLLASGLPLINAQTDSVARQAGIAWGLSHLLVVLPYWSKRRSMWLPSETLADVNLEDVFEGKVDGHLRALLLGVCDRIGVARRDMNRALAQAKLGPHFAALSPACLARRQGKLAVPLEGPTWATRGNASLLERQIQLTLSVAFGRV
jgi:phytoene/squalene synthetase